MRPLLTVTHLFGDGGPPQSIFLQDTDPLPMYPPDGLSQIGLAAAGLAQRQVPAYSMNTTTAGGTEARQENGTWRDAELSWFFWLPGFLISSIQFG